MRKLFILALLVFSGVAYAQTCNGASPTWTAATASYADVNACFGKAGFTDGDTVNIPAGTATWTSALVIPCHSFALTGAGTSSTHITSNVTPSGWTDSPIWVEGCSSKEMRFTGIDWTYTSAGSFGLMTFTGGTGLSIRIDNNNFSASVNSKRAISMMVPPTGNGIVIDHNTFDKMGYIVKSGRAGDTGVGDYSWTQAMSFGAVGAVYFEDNTFTYALDTDMDCTEGARIVFRYNTVTGSTVGSHGYDSVDNGCVFIEAYHNVLNGNGTGYIGLQLRGGSGIFYDNQIGGTYTGYRIGLTDYRSANGAGNPTAHGYCDGTNADDQNTAAQNGWRCYEQVGQGAPTVKGTSFTDSPVYQWNNCITQSAPWTSACIGTADAVSSTVYTAFSGGSFDYTSSHIAANRDYYEGTGTFTGATGVGRGLLASRPATCTAGVAYWGMDTSTLYNCSATNTWSTYYTPYTYPHPLQGATPDPTFTGKTKINIHGRR